MSKPIGFSRIQIRLHWVVALLVGFQLVFGDGMSDAWKVFVKGGSLTYSPAVIVHIVVGDLVFLLVAWRLILRSRRGVPAPADGESELQILVAKAVHISLYVVLFLTPISGALAVFGKVQIAGGVHELMKGAILALVALHIVGALYNQYVLKNGLMARMIRAK